MRVRLVLTIAILGLGEIASAQSRFFVGRPAGQNRPLEKALAKRLSKGGKGKGVQLGPGGQLTICPE